MLRLHNPRFVGAVLVCVLILASVPAAPQQAAIHYVYDELHRLVAVVDQQGKAATYTYAAAGNILRIERFDAAAIPGAVGITLVAPGSREVGGVIQIFGKGFDGIAAGNSVSVNGVLATVISAAPNRVVVAVPDGATSGPLTIATAQGTAQSATDFVVLRPIAITPAAAMVVIGATRQFQALVDGVPTMDVRWTVNDMRGGDPAVGSITDDGLYRAPPEVPTPSIVTVTAIQNGNAALRASATVTITPPLTPFVASTPVSVGFTPQDRADGSFASSAVWRGLQVVGDSPGLQRLIDMNGDGRVDWLYLSPTAGGFVYLNDGRGGFVDTAVEPRLNYGSEAPRQKFADVDGDGRPDWIHVSGAGGGILHLNDGGGGFLSPPIWSGLGYLGAVASRQLIIDLNGDGRADWLHFNVAGGGIVHLSNGQGFDATPVWSGLAPVGSDPSRQIIVDLNGDGRPDWLHIRSTGGGGVYLNDGTGRFSATPAWSGLEYLGPNIAHQKLGDVNGDGRPDWIHISGAGGGLVHLNTGTGGFDATAAWLGLQYLGADPTRQMFVDVDGDGRVDWVHISGAGGGLVHLNDGENGFQPTAAWSGLQNVGADPSRQVLVDVSGDGFPDWVHTVSGAGGGLVHLSVELPAVIDSVTPNSVAGGTTVTVTLRGVAFTTATMLEFFVGGVPDPHITTRNFLMNADGRGQDATVEVTVAAGAAPGPRVVRMTTAAGVSSATATAGNVLTVP